MPRSHLGRSFRKVLLRTQAFPDNCLCLVDTYDTLLSGVPNFLVVALALIDRGFRPKGAVLPVSTGGSWIPLPQPHAYQAAGRAQHLAAAVRDKLPWTCWVKNRF